MRDQVHDNVLDLIGNTPLVRINNITRHDGLACEIGTVLCAHL